ncbi:FAD-dependent monooxygenase [Niallia oryzisoli]|uniref:FAD-dependent monooxygenase n=1 Tax=Niallia oryzisoli TaxID=1737571 RepID=UPI0037358D2E
MGDKTINVEVCIVGAGPSGSLLGYLLAKMGISTLVIDRSSGDTPPFRGEHISAETEEMLKELHLFKKIEEKGLLRMERVEFIEHGRIVKEIHPQGSEEHVGIHVPQAHLIRTILEEAKQYKNFYLMLKTKCSGLIQDDHGAYCGVVAISGKEEWRINCSTVIGADGRYSIVRKLADIPVEMIQHGYDVLWAKIPSPSGWEPTVRLLLTHGKQLALFTQTGGYVQIGWNIEKGTFGELKQSPFKFLLTPLEENIPELIEPMHQHLTSWKDIVFLDVFSSKSQTWVKDGLVIIGDAAHTMTPTGAVGINTGMKDAYLLAPILSEAVQSKQFGIEMLSEFELKRRDHVELLQDEQVQEEKSFVFNFKDFPLKNMH